MPPAPPRPLVPMIAALAALAGCALPLEPVTDGATGRDNPNVESAARRAEPLGDSRNRPEVWGSRSEFYPLQVGNRWHYSCVSVARGYDLDGSLFATLTNRGTDSRELVCAEELFGREYLVEQRMLISTSYYSAEAETTVGWFRYRQDGTRLNRAFV